MINATRALNSSKRAHAVKSYVLDRLKQEEYRKGGETGPMKRLEKTRKACGCERIQKWLSGGLLGGKMAAQQHVGAGGQR